MRSLLLLLLVFVAESLCCFRWWRSGSAAAAAAAACRRRRCRDLFVDLLLFLVAGMVVVSDGVHDKVQGHLLR